MGLLLSVIVICVSAIEFLAVYPHFRRSFEPSTSSRDLSPLIRRCEEGLYKERQRIINILERYKKSQNCLAENDIDIKQNIEIGASSSIATITCNDVCNDAREKNYDSIAENSELDRFNNSTYWSNSSLIEKTKQERTRLKLYNKRVNFEKNLKENEPGCPGTSSTFEVSNCVLGSKNENLGNVNDNNNYLTQDEAVKQLYHFNEYLSCGLTPEEAWDVYKKTVSSDEDENRPFYELEFLQTLDGVTGKSLSKDSFMSTINAEASWNPNRVVVSSDESGEFDQTVLSTKRKRRSFRKKKRSSSSIEIKHDKTELLLSCKCENDAIENVNQNAIFDESTIEKNSAENAFWLIFSGEYTKAMNKDWHGQHFCCWQCDESLTGQRYVLRDEHPYCVACYESVFANSCEKCSRIIGIDSKDLSYKDKHWHEACFLCATCSDSLVDKQFGSKGERIYCGRCYDEQFASRCDGCGQIFRAGK